MQPNSVSTLVKIRIAFLMVVALLFATATNAFADELADVTQASDSARLTLKKAISERDSGLLASLFTANAALISANGYSVSGRLKIRMAAKVAMLTGASGTLNTVRGTITIIDDTAYETGSYTFIKTGGSPQQQTVYNGHYTLIWRIEDKAWKVHRAIGMK